MKREFLSAVVLLLACVVIGSIAFYFYDKNHDSGLQARIDGLIGQITSLQQQDTIDKKEIEKLNEELGAELTKRRLLDAEIMEIRAANDALLAENANYKKQLSSMTDLQLLAEMGKYVGREEVGLISNSNFHFSLTRPGGEKAVAIFADRDTYFSLAQNRLAENQALQGKITSLEISLVKESQQTLIERNGKENAMKTLADVQFTLSDTKKELKRTKTKSTVKGIVIGVLVTTVVVSIAK